MAKHPTLTVVLLALAFAWPIPSAGEASENVTSPACRSNAMETVLKPNARQARARAKFTLDLIVAAADAGNVTVSPSGVAAVLGALEIGADTPMRSAIGRALGVGRRGDRIEALRRDMRYLRAIDGSTDSFAVFDALVLDSGLQPSAGLLDRVKSELGIDAESVRFDDPTVIQSINERVRRWTSGRIDGIIEPGETPSLVALNAFAFKGCWAVPFDPADTRKAPFTRVDGITLDRPMMLREGDDINFIEKGRFVGVELGYTDARFALVLLTTRDVPARAADFRGEAALLTGAGFKAGRARLSLPRFGATATAELLAPLARLGLDRGLASPTALARFGDGVRLDAVRQKTFIAVDEVGTEAAAATAAMALRSADVRPFATLTFDKPFVYALRHKATGLVLMAGYVGEPEEEGSRADGR